MMIVTYFWTTLYIQHMSQDNDKKRVQFMPNMLAIATPAYSPYAYYKKTRKMVY